MHSFWGSASQGAASFKRASLASRYRGPCAGLALVTFVNDLTRLWVGRRCSHRRKAPTIPGFQATGRVAH